MARKSKIIKKGETRHKILRNLGKGSKAPIVAGWDGKWRIVLLDLPEDRKPEREALRYLLKKAGFKAVKNSVWVSPFPFEHLFGNIKKDLGLSSELMIIVSGSLDPETEKIFKAM